MLILSEEGKKYLKDGLPEVNLYSLLDKDPIEIDYAKDKIKNFSIGLIWGKKNGWITIKGSKILKLKQKEGYTLPLALAQISKGEKVEQQNLDLLIKRKLVIKEKKANYRKIGGSITSLTPELIQTRQWKEFNLKPYNVKAVGSRIFPGKRQPYTRFINNVKRKLVELGFKEMTGTLIETEFWNFDALFQPQNHPARDWTSTYKLKNPEFGHLPNKRLVDNVKNSHENGISGSRGWGYQWDPMKAARLMPRAHGTCLSARTLASNKEGTGKYFAVARCYRPDVLDSTHLIEFNQIEGIVVDESLNLSHLLGILEIFAKEIAGAEKIRFFPDYYPFTEPSVQLSAKHPEFGWMEFGGSGIFREELTKPLGINIPVIAWGIGIDRLAMFKLGVDDIRNLFSKDLKWLRESKVAL
jgi:phenylalanyl-tRNA synthetase alpha chain|tara:strand:- start:5330 stop:6565 length:1236 start_codon:yes stop_codon:yes gene_type:complete